MTNESNSNNNFVKKTFKTAGAIICATLAPAHYLMYKKIDNEPDLFVGGATGGCLLSAILTTAVIGVNGLVSSNTKYSIGDQQIETKKESLVYRTIGKYTADEEEDNFFKFFGSIGLGFVSPTYFLYHAITNPVVTQINEKYKIEGDDIIQFSSEQGYILNEQALKERNFVIDKKTYDQKELKNNLEEKISNYKNIQEEIKKLSDNGEFTQAMNLNTQYLTEVDNAKKDFAVVEKVRINLINNLNKTISELNEKTYQMRNEIKKDYEDRNIKSE